MTNIPSEGGVDPTVPYSYRPYTPLFSIKVISSSRGFKGKFFFVPTTYRLLGVFLYTLRPL